MRLDYAALWSEFVPTTNPHERIEPKLKIPINGSNYGKPYPPKGGANELPAPNPPRKENEVKTVSVKTPVSHPVATHSSPVSSPAAPGVHPAPVAPAAPAALPPGWAQTYQESQKQTAEAHMAYMQAMAQTHTAYLNAIDRSFQSLAGQAGLPSAPNALPAAPLPAPVMAQPVMSAPVMPAPVAAAPPAPVAPAPVAAPIPAAPPVAAPPTAPAVDLHALLLEVVSEKTGYPSEMLNMEMELEADLGIDSIKRVEILSSMNERAPGIPQVDTTVMATLATLGQVVDYMNGQLEQSSGAASVTPAPTPPTNGSAPASTPAPASTVDLHALLLEVVSQKTGYPSEMLNMEMELEADLGIDSIKRVEILSSMNDLAPGIPEVDTTVMAKLATLGQVVDYMNGQTGRESKASPMRAASAADAAGETAEPPDAPYRGRYLLDAVDKPPIGMAQNGLFGAGPIVVTDEGSGLADDLVEALVARGVDALAVTEIPAGDLRGVIFLGGLRKVTGDLDATRVNREAFEVAQAVAVRFEDRAPGAGVFVTVQDTGGSFGTRGFEPARAWLAGCAALARTLAQEWPGVSVKAIDLERAGRSGKELAVAIADELIAGGPDLDVGLSGLGRRITLRNHHVDVVRATPTLVDGNVVVASGGARGVTATTMIRLAGEAALRFVLLGRTEIADEPTCCRGIEGDAELKRALLADAVAKGEKLTPAILGKRVAGVVASREVRETIAQIEKVGSQARYLAADVTSLDSVTAALKTVRAEWGDIAAIVHGAGVIADKRVAEKTSDQFDRVFNTKVEGLRTLLAATHSDPLTLLCLFSSVAARCGNIGQVDYAMANEILNKVALAEARRRGGKCLVKSMGWGPWEGGMVSPQLKAHFEAMNVPLIPLSVGATMLVDEVSGSAPEQVELVLGGEPKAEALAAANAQQRTVSVNVLVGDTTHPYLADHAIKGTPVVPVALAIEWFSRIARAFGPDLVLAELSDLKVLRGIALRDFTTSSEPLVVTARQLTNGSGATLALELTDAKGGVYYRCEARLVEKRAAARPGHDDVAELSLSGWGDAAVYDGELLFHGPRFQAIKTIGGISDRGMVAQLTGVAQSSWTDTSSAVGGNPWSSDPLAFDGGLQLALLWCKHVLGGASLPTAIAGIRIWNDAPNTGAIHCTLTGQSAKGSKSVSDLAFRDARGTLLAEFVGVETHLLPTNG